MRLNDRDLGRDRRTYRKARAEEKSSMARFAHSRHTMRWGSRSQWKADRAWEDRAGRVEWTDAQRWEEARAVKSSGAGDEMCAVGPRHVQGSSRAGRWKQARS